jgi:hypothetical protein
MYKTDKNDAPLPLLELKRWISEDVFSWIQQGDEKQEKLKKELEENSAFNSDDESTANRRVQEWSSSSIHPNGIGGFRSLREGKGEECDDSDGKTNEHAVRVIRGLEILCGLRQGTLRMYWQIQLSVEKFWLPCCHVKEMDMVITI